MTEPQARLPLEGSRKARFANYAAGPNRAAVSALRDWLESADADQCLLCGPAGVGKTHLLRAAAEWWAATGRPWRIVPLGQGATLPAAGEISTGLVLIDELEQLSSEQALPLMRAIDAAREGAWRVLMASRVAVDALTLPFEDLRSRLAWGSCLTLRVADEPSARRLLERRAEELGIQWPERNTTYLLRRLPRQPAVLLATLEAAYERAVAQGRPVSVPLLTQVLQSPQFAAAVEEAGAEPQGGG